MRRLRRACAGSVPCRIDAAPAESGEGGGVAALAPFAARAAARRGVSAAIEHAAAIDTAAITPT